MARGWRRSSRSPIRSGPSLRAASRRAMTTACAVGSLVSATRSCERATIASSTTATAALGRSPSDRAQLGLRERFAHVQLVVHRADDTGPGRPAAPPRPLARDTGPPGRRTIQGGRHHPVPATTTRAPEGPDDHDDPAPHRHPHRRGRRPRPQQRHQERRLPRRGDGRRGRRHPARLEGPHPPAAGRGPGRRVGPALGPDQHPDDRPDRWDDPPHLPDQPPQDEREAAASTPVSRAHRLDGRGRRPLRPDTGRPRQHRAPGDHRPDRDRR